MQMSYSTSTYSMTFGLRRSIATMQEMLGRHQKELTTGRIADPGVSLGSGARMGYILQNNLEETRAILATNRRITIRVDATQNALANLQQTAEAMRATFLVSQDNVTDPGALASQARTSLALLVSTINSDDGDGFLFGGQRSDTAPIADYFAPTLSPARMALDAALIDPVAGFGFPADSPQVAQLTTQRIAEFIDGSFADLFSEASWKSQWSSASDAVLENRISLHQTIDASMSANDPALRKIAMAYVMVSELGISGMTNEGARTLIRKATATLDEGMALLKTSRARVGVMQQSIEIADENLQSYSDMLEIEATRLGAVDRSETATRINEVLTRIETAYALTARISQLSLTRYI